MIEILYSSSGALVKEKKKRRSTFPRRGEGKCVWYNECVSLSRCSGADQGPGGGEGAHRGRSPGGKTERGRPAGTPAGLQSQPTSALRPSHPLSRASHYSQRYVYKCNVHCALLPPPPAVARFISISTPPRSLSLSLSPSSFGNCELCAILMLLMTCIFVAARPFVLLFPFFSLFLSRAKKWRVR